VRLLQVGTFTRVALPPHDFMQPVWGSRMRTIPPGCTHNDTSTAADNLAALLVWFDGFPNLGQMITG